MEAIKRLFSPEFRNRLDAIIQFAPLDAATIERVVDKLLVEAEAQLEQKGVSIERRRAARRWIAKKGYDPKMGARPMARVIQEHIKRPLAEELLFGKLTFGARILHKGTAQCNAQVSPATAGCAGRARNSRNARGRAAAQAAQMRRGHLAVDQFDAHRFAAGHKARQRRLGGVAPPRLNIDSPKNTEPSRTP
jgi:hypothetical protein